MKSEIENSDAANGEPTSPPECCKCLTTFIRTLVSEALKEERARETAAEAALWAACFGPGAASKPKAQLDHIARTASARALLTIINADRGVSATPPTTHKAPEH